MLQFAAAAEVAFPLLRMFEGLKKYSSSDWLEWGMLGFERFGYTPVGFSENNRISKGSDVGISVLLSVARA